MSQYKRNGNLFKGFSINRFSGNLLTGATAKQLFALWLSFALLPPDAAAETVFRCVAADGSIEFSQWPCGAGIQNEEIIIEDQMVGWEAPRITPKKENKKQARKKLKNRRAAATASSQAKKRQEKDCWKKKQQIETVQHRLRRGYTARQGVELRQKRRQYEAYLSKFCR